MDLTALSLIEVIPQLKRTLWHTFEASDKFPQPWWRPCSTPPGTGHWLSFQLDSAEVARCKFDLYDDPCPAFGLGAMPDGQLDIKAFEVATSMRRRGIGRKALMLIRERYPEPRLTALNDDAQSRKFWDGVGWTRHEAEHPFLRGGERVTYSER